MDRVEQVLELLNLAGWSVGPVGCLCSPQRPKTVESWSNTVSCQLSWKKEPADVVCTVMDGTYHLPFQRESGLFSCELLAISAAAAAPGILSNN